MVVTYDSRRITNKSGLFRGCMKRFKKSKRLKEPQPVKPTTTRRWLLLNKHCHKPKYYIYKIRKVKNKRLHN
jgi:hypothetical protein